MYALHPSMVRLVALSMAHQILKENTPGIAILDPYYMKEMFLSTPKGRAKASQYIGGFFGTHHEKNIFLMPYFPE